MAFMLLAKSITNEQEAENIAEYSKLFGKIGFTGVMVIGLLLGIWFSVPMFMKTIDDDFQRKCQHTNGGKTSFDQTFCKLKK